MRVNNTEHDTHNAHTFRWVSICSMHNGNPLKNQNKMKIIRCKPANTTNSLRDVKPGKPLFRAGKFYNMLACTYSNILYIILNGKLLNDH